MTVILLTCIFNSMQKNTPKRIPLEKLAEIADVALIITHTLCHFISMQMISTSTISTFAFWRAILKIINRKLTELKLLLVFKPISLVSIETVSHDIFTRLGFWLGWVNAVKLTAYYAAHSYCLVCLRRRLNVIWAKFVDYKSKS